MTQYCPRCGEKLKDDALYCANCGEKIPRKSKFLNKNLILIIIAVVILIAVSTIFLTNQTQTVKVDNVEFELPADYVKEPIRTDVDYDGNVKSSAMGWSNDENYIEIGVARTPGAGIDSEEVASTLNGTPTKMYGYTGYILDYGNEGCGFVFGIQDEVILVYVSDYDVFDDVKVIGKTD
ncbi:zinc ribbon domain-containing protein [Methanobrevibacter sp.]